MLAPYAQVRLNVEERYQQCGMDTVRRRIKLEANSRIEQARGISQKTTSESVRHMRDASARRIKAVKETIAREVATTRTDDVDSLMH